MNRDGHAETVFFVGPEVEHTPAYSKKTLFVVGKPTIADILVQALAHKTPHVFMGADHSFDANEKDTDAYWSNTISTLLDKGYWVTLDYQAHQHVDVLPMLNAAIWHSRSFVPLLSVRIPKIETSSINLTVKIDDIDFKATNPGVWCMHFTEVTDSNRFTDWQDYGSDIVVDLNKVIPEPVIVAPRAPAQITKAAAAHEVHPDINDGSLGVDTKSKTMLKPEPVDMSKPAVTASAAPQTATTAAEAYAEGATSDPLSAKHPKAKAAK